MSGSFIFQVNDKACLEDIRKRSDLQILEGPKPMGFKGNGYLLPLVAYGGAGKFG